MATRRTRAGEASELNSCDSDFCTREINIITLELIIINELKASRSTHSDREAR